ncbi:MAG: nucleotidyltransferase family protein [Planctomycetes bacterium]|nr:nucleotidyltransferase family protein [Planctomycetota bacterium]
MGTKEILRTLEMLTGDLRRLGVRRIALFGSAARGEASAASDLDFLVEFERKSFDTYMDLKFLLEDAFGRRVDLVLADSIKPRLRKAIAREAVYAQGS